MIEANTNRKRTNFDKIKSMSLEEMAYSRLDRIDMYCKSDTEMWIGDFDGIDETEESAVKAEIEWLESEVTS